MSNPLHFFHLLCCVLAQLCEHDFAGHYIWEDIFAKNLKND